MGVALAAGMKGENAVALRTTVLVTVVLSVVIFGGTIGRMIEILGIRTGVEEEDEDSSDDEGNGYQLGGEDDLERFSGKGRKRRGSVALSGKSSMADDSPMQSPFRDYRQTAQGSTSRRGNEVSLGGRNTPMNLRSQSQGQSHRSMGSDLSQSSSVDSDTDILPSAASGESTEKSGDLTRVWRDGQWFTVLDERYLLPVFSNATASRRQASKKAAMKANRSSMNLALGEDGDGDDDSPPSSAGMGGNSPYLSSSAGGGGRQKDYAGSLGDILSSLVSPSGNTLGSSSSSTAGKRRESVEGGGSGQEGGAGEVGGFGTIDLNLTSMGDSGRASKRSSGLSRVGSALGSGDLGSPARGGPGGGGSGGKGLLAKFDS